MTLPFLANQRYRRKPSKCGLTETKGIWCWGKGTLCQMLGETDKGAQTVKLEFMGSDFRDSDSTLRYRVVPRLELAEDIRMEYICIYLRRLLQKIKSLRPAWVTSEF